MGSGLPPVTQVTEWVAKHLSISLGSRAGFACHIDASAVLPLSAAQAYELLTHPGETPGTDHAQGRAALGKHGGLCLLGPQLLKLAG